MDLAIVGNGPINPYLFDQIEKANFIIRFNSPPTAHDYAGMRTDRLVISNSSKQTQRLLSSDEYMDRQVFAGASEIFLPYHPDIIKQLMPKPNVFSWLKGRKADLTGLCEEVAKTKGKQVQILDALTYFEACEQLDIMGDRRLSAFPSSGMLTIFHSLKHSQDAEMSIRLFGFGFAGWKRHDWSAEKRYAEFLISRGKIIRVT
jgi:hypothetical protein